MADTETKLSPLEALKEGSRQLRGTIAEEFADKTTVLFNGDNAQLLKHHGTYQQDDRDLRNRKDEDGNKLPKHYIMMVRAAIPGGVLTADQFLAMVDLGDKFANKTIRLTTRQGIQYHGILKNDLKPTIKAINDIALTTFAACGDVSRNVMCCPAPIKDDPVRVTMQEHAAAMAVHMRPKTTSYHELWLTDEDGNRENHAPSFEPVDEPIYGKTYLPRKFKIGFALPDDNCIDALAYDLGFIAIRGEDNTLAGYDVYVGGGQGVTPAKKNTEPLVGKLMCFITPDEVFDISTAIVKVQRDFGNRADRKQARMKYLIREQGLDWFRDKVQEYYRAEGGGDLKEPNGAPITDSQDHIGWFPQGDGKWALGVDVEGGRIFDAYDQGVGHGNWKSGLKAVVETFKTPVYLTALHAVILGDIEESQKDEVERILKEHHVPLFDDLSPLRRYSMACVGLPTCGLSVTDSERALPGVLDMVESCLDEAGLTGERLTMHMTGCPNGCARPYTPDLGLVGKSKGRYTIYVGGNPQGTRIGFIYDDQVPVEELPTRLGPLFASFAEGRQNGECFGDFCARVGKEGLPEPAAA